MSVAHSSLSAGSRDLQQVRACTVVVFLGLILSGLTAFPLLAELNLLTRWVVGSSASLHPADYEGFTHWVLKVREGLDVTYAAYPFLGYGTDWLAFGHIVIAFFFIPVWRDPVRYQANITVGIWASVLVFPLAFICGPIRGIPFYWRCIDCCFGLVALVPLLWMRSRVKRMEADAAQPQG